MTTQKRGGARPGAGRKPAQKSLRERAEGARLEAIKQMRRELQAEREALVKLAQAKVQDVLGVADTKWTPSDGDRMVETVVEGLRIQYDKNMDHEGLYVWAWAEYHNGRDGGYGWTMFEDLADLGEILADQPPDTDAQAAAAKLTLPEPD